VSSNACKAENAVNVEKEMIDTKTKRLIIRFNDI